MCDVARCETQCHVMLLYLFVIHNMLYGPALLCWQALARTVLYGPTPLCRHRIGKNCDTEHVLCISYPGSCTGVQRSAAWQLTRHRPQRQSLPGDSHLPSSNRAFPGDWHGSDCLGSAVANLQAYKRGMKANGPRRWSEGPAWTCEPPDVLCPDALGGTSEILNDSKSKPWKRKASGLGKPSLRQQALTRC